MSQVTFNNMSEFTICMWLYTFTNLDVYIHLHHLTSKYSNPPQLPQRSSLFFIPKIFFLLIFEENQTSGKLISYLINILSSETVFLLYFFSIKLGKRRVKTWSPILNQTLIIIICIKMSRAEATDCVKEIEWDPLYHSHGKFQLFRSLDSVFWLFHHQLKEMIINKSNTRKNKHSKVMRIKFIIWSAKTMKYFSSITTL